MVSHGRDRDDGFRNPRVAEASPHRSGAEARRTPPRVRPLMEIVGSDEQLACMGFALSSAALGLTVSDRTVSQRSEGKVTSGTCERTERYECICTDGQRQRKVQNSWV